LADSFFLNKIVLLRATSKSCERGKSIILRATSEGRLRERKVSFSGMLRRGDDGSEKCHSPGCFEGETTGAKSVILRDASKGNLRGIFIIGHFDLSDKSFQYLFAFSINTSFHSRFHFLSCFSLAIACFGFSNISR